MRGDVRESAGTKIALELRRHNIDTITRRAHMAVPSPQTVPVQLHQADDRLVLATPMPGLEPQDIAVVIRGARVTIRGEYRGSRQEQPELLVSEWTIGPYYCEITLPQPVNGVLTNATYGNGVLVLSMPTLEPGQQGGETEFRLEALTGTKGQRVGHTGSDRQPTLTQAQQALTALQTAMADRPSEDVRAHGRSAWEAVIRRAEGYDEEATAEVDPSHTSETAVFADGSRLWWNAALNAWETGPASERLT
jgi:HSP20 family protein